MTPTESIGFDVFSTSDEGELLDMMADFYAIDGYPFDPEGTRANLQHFSANESLGRIYIIRRSPDLVGYMILAFGFSFEYGGRDAFIDELFLKKEFRGAGIGTRAIDFILQQAPELGIKALHLEVERHNERAARLYLDNGFEPTGRHLLTKRIQ